MYNRFSQQSLCDCCVFSESEVYNYLEEFLKDAQLVTDQEMAPASTELARTPTLLEFNLLIIHCIEVRVWGEKLRLRPSSSSSAFEGDHASNDKSGGLDVGCGLQEVLLDCDHFL